MTARTNKELWAAHSATDGSSFVDVPSWNAARRRVYVLGYEDAVHDYSNRSSTRIAALEKENTRLRNELAAAQPRVEWRVRAPSLGDGCVDFTVESRARGCAKTLGGTVRKVRKFPK